MLSLRFRSLVFATALALVSSCTSGDEATAPSPSPRPSELLGSGGLLGTGLGKGLLTCTPLPYAQAQQTVGAAGGTIQVGPHVLAIPAGALDTNVTITAEVIPDSVNTVRFQPEGLHFASSRPARLTMSYANCSLLGQLTPKRIVYTTDLLQILEWLLSLDDPLHQRVSADIAHFSRYGIAW